MLAFAFLGAACAGSLHAATLYVSPLGVDQSGGGSSANPLATLGYAVSKASAGDTIQLAGGSFIVASTVTVDKPLTIKGAGRNDVPPATRTVLQAGYVDAGLAGTTNYGTPVLRITAAASGSRVEGIEFDGNVRQAGGAIHVESGATQVVITSCDFLRFYSSAVLMTAVGNAEVSYCAFEDSGAENTGGSTGMLMVVGATDSQFHHLDFTSAENGLGSSGYGVKGRGKLTRVQFYNLTTDLKAVQAWNSGTTPNFGLELWGYWDFDPDGKLSERCEEVQIYNCSFKNTVSLAMQQQDPAGLAYAVRFHHNVIDPKGWYGLEVSMRGLLIDYNHFKQADSPMHNFVTANGSTQDVRVEYNLAENVRNRFICFEGWINNLQVRNNTVFLTPRSTATEKRDFVVFGSSNGPGQNVTLHNNVVVAAADANGIVNSANYYRGTNIPVNLLAYGAVGSNVVFPTTATYSLNGLYDKIVGDPQLTLSGATPAPYYQPATVSVSRDSGFNWGANMTGYAYLGTAPDRGAIENGNDYAETFPNSTNNNQPASTVGWLAYASNSASSLGATVNNVTNQNNVVAISNGAGVTGTVPLNSGSNATTSNGFLWTGGGGAKEALACTNERYSATADWLDFSEVSRLTWRAGNGATSIVQKAAIKVSGQWYVSETAVSTPAMGANQFAAQAVSVSLDPNSTLWRRVTFTPGTSGFQFATSTVSAAAIVGRLESAGVYFVNSGAAGGNSRIDSFAVVGTFKPGLF